VNHTTDDKKVEPQPAQAQPQITVPEDLRQAVQEFSIRSSGYDVARRDYSVEANKLLTALLQKINSQAEEIKKLLEDATKKLKEPAPKA
jgi:hypothetical protein